MKKMITVKELADLSNLTGQRIYQLISEEKMPALQDGKLLRDESISALFKFYQRDSEELKRERLLLTAANRELKEQELKIAKSEFIEKRIAHNSIQAFAIEFKNIVRIEIEKNGPAKRREKLTQLGLSESAIQQFHSFDLAAEIEVITKIENKCAEASKIKIQ